MVEKNLMHADFAGVLRGERLAEAYANMDVFVFPSYTDTFGNVVLEASASGVPAVVSDLGGPKFIVRHRETGFVACGRRDFCQSVVDLMDHPEKRRSMSLAARDYALGQSWDEVFDGLYRRYNRMRSSGSSAPQDFPAVRCDLSAAVKEGFSERCGLQFQFS